MNDRCTFSFNTHGDCVVMNSTYLFTYDRWIGMPVWSLEIMQLKDTVITIIKIVTGMVVNRCV